MKAWIVGAATLALAASAHAGVIVSPTTISADATFPGPPTYFVSSLIDHSGLTADFVSGVTDFDAYIAGDPRHDWDNAGEWFTPFNAPGAVLTMDLGASFRLESLALWADEYWGAGLVTVATSTDGLGFVDVGSGAPTDWPAGVAQQYAADVFSLAPSTARYVRLTLSACPQPDSAPSGGCGLGEIAFEAVPVPEPATWALMIAGFGALGVVARRRRASELSI